MNGYRMIALDIDGTLLNSKKEVTGGVCQRRGPV